MFSSRTLFLFVTLLSFLIHPQHAFPHVIYKEIMPSQGSPSYDTIMHVLDQIESGELETNSSEETLENLNRFLIALARTGALPGDANAYACLETDCAELLQKNTFSYASASSAFYPADYVIVPAYPHSHRETLLCRGWWKKQWDQSREFVKKHKKPLIIGAAILVGGAIIGTAVAASVGAAASAAAAASDTSKHKEKPASDPTPTFDAQALETLSADPQVIAFKETILQEQFLDTEDSFSHELSWKEQGRVLGSAFAHDRLKHIESDIQNSGLRIEHGTIDAKFSTDYANAYTANSPASNFKALAYQGLGEKALEKGRYDQAVRDLGKAIALNPISPIPYLERGVAHFHLGDYDRSAEDYRRFAAHVEPGQPLSIPSFSLGLAKGLPKGIYESGRGTLSFFADAVTHPLQTGQQMWEAMTTLVELAKTEKWSTLSRILVPEVHQLVQEWDALPPEQRGELAGYAFGKHGTDIITPLVAIKLTKRGIQLGQELTAVSRRLKTAEHTLLLESTTLARETELTARETIHLQQTGKLESTVGATLESTATQSENAFLEAARRGESHGQLFQNYFDRSTREIQKSIRSLDKQIAIHQEKILNPYKYIPIWDELHPDRKNALIHIRWPTEIKCFTEQKTILQSILDQRMGKQP